MKFFAVVPVLVHFFIFYMETWGWGKSWTKKVMGTRDEDVEPTRVWAFNQGWYNLFLALAVVGGLVILVLGLSRDCAFTLVSYGLGSMVLASGVLIARSREKTSAALFQGLPALVSLVLFWL